MAITINAKAYDQHRISTDLITYKGPNHTFSVKDLLALSAKAPKPNGDFRGNARSFIKLTRTLTLDNATTADAIVEISYQVPVGAANADVDAMSDDLGSLLSSANIDSIVRGQDITW